jgi:hypothetical protein
MDDTNRVVNTFTIMRISDLLINSGIVIYDNDEYNKRYKDASKGKYHLNDKEMETMRHLAQSLHQHGGMRAMMYSYDTIIHLVRDSFKGKNSSVETAGMNMAHVKILLDKAWDGIGDWTVSEVIIIQNNKGTGR